MLTSKLSVCLCLGALVAACSPDVVAPGYEDPDPESIGGGAGAGAGGSGSAPLTGRGGVSPASEAGGATSILGTAGGSSNAGGHPVTTSAGGGSVNAGGGPAAPNCDLSGRWMVTQRAVVEAIGVQQAVRMWLYFEFAQNGTQVTATRGLDCGYDVVPLTAVAGAADLHKSWPKITANNPETGRKGTITQAGSGCAVAFEPSITVDGATVSHYRDPAQTLPGPSEQATGNTPGWEDWDEDGKPGISYHLSGVASGAVFVSARHTNTWAGTIPSTHHAFTVPDTFKQEEDLLGYDGSPLLTTTSSVSANPALHFAEFARLEDAQATGDDMAVCNAVRALAPTLTPKGNEKPVQ